MKRVVVDASVVLKWFFRLRDGEQDVAAALRLLQGVSDNQVALLQPPHFIAEVAAVLARQWPSMALASLNDLLDLEMLVVESAAIYARAVDLASRHGHHLFDTLYHAVALELGNALLITADARYARKARSEGGIVLLADFDFNALRG